jgi:hypothetical protein
MASNKKGSGFANASFLLNECRTGESSAQRSYENYVPLDYMKAQIKNFDPKLLLTNKNLSFGRLINEDTGEIIVVLDENKKKRKPFRKATYRNLIFKYYPQSGYMTLSGSLHKFSNDLLQNCEDFKISDFNRVLIELYNRFGLLPQNLKITKLEWAVNIQIEMVNEIIDHCILFKKKEFSDPLGRSKARFREVELTEYLIKIYNKGLHFLLDRDILRIERKQMDWTKYSQQQKIGNTLLDLIESDFKGLNQLLCENWLEIVFFDPCIPLSNKRILKYRDPKTWDSYKTTSRTNQMKHRNILKKANREIGKNLQEKIHQKMIQKINELNTEKVTIPNFKYIPNTLTPIIFIHYGIEDLNLSA